MHRAWIVLLAGCGFQSTVSAVDAGAADAPIADSGSVSSGCASVAYMALSVSACPLAPVPSIMITANVSLDTDAGTSIPEGLGCSALSSASTNVCAIAASGITIAGGATLSAHGSRPLALIGHLIDVEGTIDVASHIDGQQGAASDAPGCGPFTRATGDGGGQGGSFAVSGGAGGDVDNSDPPENGGLVIPSFGITALRGGCPGGPSSLGPSTVGGHSGGAVWLAVDANGTLTLGSAAVINASGAGGAGGGTVIDNLGGYGGGSGGMILVKTPALAASASSQMFAEGGGGGGGGGVATTPGRPGADPIEAGAGGAGGLGETTSSGAGGIGFPAEEDERKGRNAANAPPGGGGGGGGGAGAIWIDVTTINGSTMMSPPPVDLTD